MSQSKTSELEDYVRNIGKYLKNVDEHIKTIYSKLDDIATKLKDIEDETSALKDETAHNADDMANLKETTVQKVDFDEFVTRLTESLRELLPPIPSASDESEKE